MLTADGALGRTARRPFVARRRRPLGGGAPGAADGGTCYPAYRRSDGLRGAAPCGVPDPDGGRPTPADPAEARELRLLGRASADAGWTVRRGVSAADGGRGRSTGLVRALSGSTGLRDDATRWPGGRTHELTDGTVLPPYSGGHSRPSHSCLAASRKQTAMVTRDIGIPRPATQIALHMGRIRITRRSPEKTSRGVSIRPLAFV